MPKWIDEKVLQKYFIDCFTRYKYKEHKIISARFNQPFDRYPDLICVLDNHKEVLAEVEWKTSDFNHDVNVLKENDGFLIVYQKDQSFELEQIEIDQKDFEKWYVKNAKTIFKQSIDEIFSEIVERKYPELWFYYLDKNSYRDFLNHSQDIGIWGVPGIVKTFRQLNRFREIKKGDLIFFLAQWKTKGTGGRVSFKKFKGTFEKGFLHLVTKDYYYDDKTKIWPDRGQWRGEIFPHRFDFNKKPILELKDIKISKLSYTTRASLHQLIYSLLWHGNASSLVDIISHAKTK